MVEDRLAKYKIGRMALDRLWYTSLLFYRGEQWITYDKSIGQFRRTNQRRVIPRPVVNMYAPTTDDTMSAISRFDPKIMFAPQTDAYEDLQAAIGSNSIVSVIEKEVGWDDCKAEWIPWMVLTGNAFVITGVDEYQGLTKTMYKTECVQCGTKGTTPTSQAEPDMCPECDSEDPPIQSPMMPILDDKTGQPKTTKEPVEKVGTEVANPFQMFFDARIHDMEEQPLIVRIHTKDVDWLKVKYPKQADKITPFKRSELNARIMSSLSTYFYNGAENPNEETADVIEVWHKPSPDFPDGFYALLTGEAPVVLELQKYPFKTKKGCYFYPIAHYRYNRLAGSAYGRTPAFDLIELQKTRNRIESIGEMILTRTSNPVWLKPTPGTTTVITGHVGQEIEYDPNITANHKPERVEASQLPPSITIWTERIDRAFPRIMGGGEIQAGQRPQNTKSGFAIQKLQEVSNDRQTAMFTNVSLATARWTQHALEIFKMISPDDRYVRILGDNKAWTISKIKNADLEGGVDVWTEPGAWAPKSHLEKLSTIEFMLQNGLIDPMDPVTRMRIAREYGMASLVPEIDVDDAYINREHDRWKQGQPIMVNIFDNAMMHMQRHLEFWKSEAFETYPQQMKDAFLQHMFQTQFQVQNGQPPPPGWPNNAPPTPVAGPGGGPPQLPGSTGGPPEGMM